MEFALFIACITLGPILLLYAYMGYKYASEDPVKEISKYANSYAQPKPVNNGGPNIHELVLQDMNDRAQFGYNKYGQFLKPEDGRDTLADAYYEALDLVQYLRKAIYERDNK